MADLFSKVGAQFCYGVAREGVFREELKTISKPLSARSIYILEDQRKLPTSTDMKLKQLF